MNDNAHILSAYFPLTCFCSQKQAYLIQLGFPKTSAIDKPGGNHNLTTKMKAQPRVHITSTKS